MRIFCALFLTFVIAGIAEGRDLDEHAERYWQRRAEQAVWNYYAPYSTMRSASSPYSSRNGFNAPGPRAEWPGRHWDRNSWRHKIHPEEFGH